MRNGFFDRRSTGIYCVPKSNCRRSTTLVSIGNYLKKCLLSLLKFRRTLAPSGDRKAQNSKLKLATSRDNSDFPFRMISTLYTQLDSVFNAYRKIRGAMKREIFLYGHFGYCFSLGRNVCSDDLVKKMQSKNRRRWRLFFCCPLRLGLFRNALRCKQAIRAEHAFNAPHCLTDTVAVFNQRETHVRVTVVTKANAWRDANLRVLKQFLANSREPIAAYGSGIFAQTYIEALGISTIQPAS